MTPQEDPISLLSSLGLDPKMLMAGFAGGLAHAFAVKNAKPGAQVASVVVGTLAANWLVPWMTDMLGIHGAGATGACGFIVGVSAMTIVQQLPEYVMSKLGVARGSVAGPDQQEGSKPQ